MGSVAATVASMLFSGGCRSLAVPAAGRSLSISRTALRNHRNKNAPTWCCRSSHNSYNALATESEFSKTDSESLTASTSSDSFPKYDRLLPCPLQKTPPRVEHLVVSEGGPVLEHICKALELPPLYVKDLIQFGAVYYALVCPQPPPSATEEQIRVFKEVTEPSVLCQRASIKGKTVREAQKTFRITHADQFVEPGTYLRVHVHPKRFPRCYEIDWRSRIIAVAESYVVLDKPAGTSVGGTTDNIEESCATFATRALGLTAPLMTTHQIDNCTEGCVVLARTKEYCSVFHGKIRVKKVKKLYLALASSPMPTGIITHYMRPINMAPRLISEDFIKGWHMCQLEIQECRKVPWPTPAIQDKYRVEDCGWPYQDFAYECKINLLTGRTHQIRAQFAACRAPVIGDSMYMPAAIADMSNPGLNPFGKYKRDFSSESEKETAVVNWIAQHGKEPGVAIGLQACQISWDDNEHFYESGSPWWRC
ncbi:RNA pseudouridine synthase 6, chloroplastic isoform X1 [Vigna umbellata]|uniref:RNA pseudouridine synthase 6, chloroplastic isoform X1 n=1 Tax=Vigna umbellata TaxID=87088 RepID=UPI001F5EED69|nr:RNA pseudouridine synthase 6, chloroplastic isoform X1 [Vigna umbellata]